MDTRELEKCPTDLRDLRRLFTKPGRPRLGYYVLITRCARMGFIGPEIMQMFIPHLRCKITELLEDAPRFIDTLQPTQTTQAVS